MDFSESGERKLKVSLLTGGTDRPYAFGLLNALVSNAVMVDFIAGDELSDDEILTNNRVNFLNFRGDTNPTTPTIQKIIRICKYYFKLLKYASRTDSKVFHILWANRFPLLDRILLNVYYKILGKKLVFTAHNVNERQRDGCDNSYNRITLRAFYSLVDHIFVHTSKMKLQLIKEFGVRENTVTVIPFGINNTLPKSDLTRVEARNRLSLTEEDKVILFFGRIARYKGLEYAVDALDRLVKIDGGFRLIVAGRIEKGCEGYWQQIESTTDKRGLGKYLRRNIGYIPDEEVEIFFKSADVLVLPYKSIFQSGVVFLAYSFGLPVIGTDVGSLKEDIIEGKTGMICRPEDSDDLADTISKYFKSELYGNLERSAEHIIDYGNRKYSWEDVGNITCAVYDNLLV